MSNFKQDILDKVGDELNQSKIIVFSNYWLEDEEKGFPKEKLGIIHKLTDVIDLLDYEFDSGFGGQECHDVLIYTPTRVIQVHEYDGSTHLYETYLTPELHLENNKQEVEK